MVLPLILWGGTALAGGWLLKRGIEETGDTAEKVGNASLKVAGAGLMMGGAYLAYKAAGRLK